MTRIAAGDTALWTQILSANAAPVAEVLAMVAADLAEAARVLAENDDSDKAVAALLDVSSTRLGLGLGLFISQQITLSHKGDIEVRSTAEAGTMFTVVLPELLAGQWAEGLGKASAASGGAPT